MKKRSFVVLSLALLMLAQATACDSGSDPSSADTDEKPAVTETVVTEAAETTPLDLLEVRDMGGYEFVMLSMEQADWQNFYHEEKDGDTINDAIRARDLAVSERLNLKITTVIGDVNKLVTKTVNAGDEAYHLIIQMLSTGISSLTTSGMLYDLTEMPYLTLDAVYWNKSMAENVRIFDKQYFTTGSISPLFYQTPIVMAFNKRIANDYDIGDMYQTVLDGKWTIDKLYEIAQTVSADINSDGKMDEDDLWGLLIDGTFGNALYTGAGYNTVERDNDTYHLTFDKEYCLSLIEKCAGLFGNRMVVRDDKRGEEVGETIFRSGRGLFMDYTILGVMRFRGMEDDFGIIPCPKLDEAQETYYTACNTWLPTGIAVPMLVSDPERTALIMETMAYLSYQNIQPAVYEIALQGKTARDDASSIMLDYIFENASYDFNTIFDFGGSSFALLDAMLGEKDNFASTYASIRDKAQNEIDKMLAFAKE